MITAMNEKNLEKKSNFDNFVDISCDDFSGLVTILVILIENFCDINDILFIFVAILSILVTILVTLVTILVISMTILVI
jgi:hypothetical protein